MAYAGPGRGGFRGGLGSCGGRGSRGRGRGRGGRKRGDTSYQIGTKQARAGQRTRFKAFVAIGDNNGHIGLSVKCSKEIATAIRGPIVLAKLSVGPVRRGYWGNKIGKPHTYVSTSWHWHCICPVPKKLLMMAGIDDFYTSTRGSILTLGNFAKATYSSIVKTYAYSGPVERFALGSARYKQFSDFLADKPSARHHIDA
uniref:Small ribosomal subunit protein uS5 n=1 Tax=Glossina pallidipes TaxID=7398 RepID=A0A1A9ZE17_GLOPL